MSMRRKSSGFTLLEMLVVIALAGIVTTLVLSAFIGMMDSWRSVVSRSSLDKAAEDIFDAMRQDIAGVASPSLAAAPLKGEDHQYRPAEAYVATALRGDDSITLVTRVTAPDGQQMVRQIAYQVNHEAEPHTLKRVLSDIGGRPIGASPVVGGVEVFWFDVHYADANGNWTDGGTWSQPTLPTAVRVELTLQDPDSGEQVIRQALIPVQVS